MLLGWGADAFTLTKESNDIQHIKRRNQMNRSWTATVVENPEDPAEMLLVFPNGLLEELGWTEETELDWTVDLETGRISIRKL